MNDVLNNEEMPQFEGEGGNYIFCEFCGNSLSPMGECCPKCGTPVGDDSPKIPDLNDSSVDTNAIISSSNEIGGRIIDAKAILLLLALLVMGGAIYLLYNYFHDSSETGSSNKETVFVGNCPVGFCIFSGVIGYDMEVNGTLNLNGLGNNFTGDYGYFGKTSGISIEGYISSDGSMTAKEYNKKGRQCGSYSGSVSSDGSTISGEMTNYLGSTYKFVWHLIQQTYGSEINADLVVLESQDIFDNDEAVAMLKKFYNNYFNGNYSDYWVFLKDNLTKSRYGRVEKNANQYDGDPFLGGPDDGREYKLISVKKMGDQKFKVVYEDVTYSETMTIIEYLVKENGRYLIN